MREQPFDSDGSSDRVPYLDFDANRIVQIPRNELASNAMQVRIRGMEDLVWVVPEELRPGPVHYKPFTENVRDYLRQIQSAFGEHRNLTLEEWEDGFRRDASPEIEIALWSHAAAVYVQFTAGESCADRRADVYRCITTCMTTQYESVWDILRPHTLDRSEAEMIVNRYFRKDA